MDNVTDDALALLHAEVARTDTVRTAERLGVSRTAVSLLINGKYTADPTRMYALIGDVLGGLHCPHLDADLSRDACRRWHGRATPPAQSAAAVAHWRACQQCPHNPLADREAQP
ncbi:helix-turn-helix domain-containing protein [Thiocystis violascens]|uniref:Transcriptional regulator n=1 Tax=Thiocystis violascens (strain ATCC 17096 / DSM 198 / 6111) TaxID=765911 RepID=I3YGS8_THIV6|nr:helix-turn-helix transcriptional regulator [Thiocystis violascens]AFL76196.1 hypothetical protein Thivi_4393 [Thiocystis violascens DSM 198]